MTGIPRAARYPQPRAVSAVLSELQAGFCEHDGVPARCPSCRAATEPEDVPDTPEPPSLRPRRRRAARHRKDDSDSPRGRLW